MQTKSLRGNSTMTTQARSLCALAFVLLGGPPACTHTTSALPAGSMVDASPADTHTDNTPAADARPSLSDLSGTAHLDTQDEKLLQISYDFSQWHPGDTTSAFSTESVGGALYVFPDFSENGKKLVSPNAPVLGLSRVFCDLRLVKGALKTITEGNLDRDPRTKVPPVLLRRFRLDFRSQIGSNPSNWRRLPQVVCYALRYEDGSWSDLHTGVPVVSKDDDHAAVEIEVDEKRRILGMVVLVYEAYIEKIELWVTR